MHAHSARLHLPHLRLLVTNSVETENERGWIQTGRGSVNNSSDGLQVPIKDINFQRFPRLFRFLSCY